MSNSGHKKYTWLLSHSLFRWRFLRSITIRNTYESLIHDNTRLPDLLKKYHYLVSAVTGSASAIVRSISLSEYKVAWEDLIKRFDNPWLIMNSHLSKLFSFAPLHSSSLNDLKHYLDIFYDNIAALKSFNAPDKKGFLLFYITSCVLVSTTKCLFESQLNNATLPVIDELLMFVQTQCQVLQNSLV